MPIRTCCGVISFCGVFAFSGLPCLGQNRNAEAPRVVKRVDHIIISVQAAEPLFELLTKTFQLPTAWPIKSYGYFSSGGVFAGNVNLEVLRGNLPNDALVSEADRVVLNGIVFEPFESIESSMSLLDQRKLSHGPALPFFGVRRDGTKGKLWTTVELPGLRIPPSMIFLCHYNWDVDERRASLLAKLRSRGGGPLGLRGVAEITIGVRDFKQARSTWAEHLRPVAEAAPAYWRLDAGPAVRLVKDDQDRIRTLVFQVASLEKATRFLEERSLLGKRGTSQTSMAGPVIGHLDIRLIE